MVDTYGRWHEEENYAIYPEEKWCAYDHMAVWIRGTGYKIKTTMENLITMILLHFTNELEETNTEFDIENCKNYVENSGGLAEFDYCT